MYRAGCQTSITQELIFDAMETQREDGGLELESPIDQLFDGIGESYVWATVAVPVFFWAGIVAVCRCYYREDLA
jgi:hypothetical protein